MKKTILLALMIALFTVNSFTQDIEKEKESIKKVIQTSYIDGLHNNGKVEDIEEGFHPGFNLLGVNKNMLTKFPIYSWIESFKNRKQKNPNPPSMEEKMECDYLLIDVTGNSAMAKIQLKKNKELIFTDYLQLYKFEEGWRVVSKNILQTLNATHIIKEEYL